MVSVSYPHKTHAYDVHLADVEAIVAPDFDDPNLDKDAALQGVLGKSLQPSEI